LAEYSFPKEEKGEKVMTDVQKDILIKDLCARLDTNLVCSIYRVDDYGVGYRDEILSGYCKGDIWREFYFGDDCGIGIDDVSKIKPYLFPLSMSSMTEEQKEDMVKSSCGIGSDKNVFDWYNKNHFDYRGLIPMGLAKDATGLNIY
jgi:hypothetical protein